MITVEPGTAGHAVLRVPGAAGALATPGFRIQRDAEWTDATLGPQGWQSSDALLAPERAEAAGPDLVLHIGWDVCRHLEGGVYTISLPAADLSPTGIYWPDIAPLHASPAVIAPPPPPPTASSSPPVAIAPPPPPPPPPVITDQVPPKKPGIGLWLGLGALLLILAGGVAWYVLQQRTPTPSPDPAPAPTPVVVPPPPPPPPEPPRPLDLTALSVPDVIAQAPNVAAITAEGQRRLGTDRKDDGLLLLETAADRADPAALAAMARLYDPAQPPGPVPPNARQAARFYRDAARAGQDVAAPREALRQYLETRRADLQIDLILKDYWP